MFLWQCLWHLTYPELMLPMVKHSLPRSNSTKLEITAIEEPSVQLSHVFSASWRFAILTAFTSAPSHALSVCCPVRLSPWPWRRIVAQMARRCWINFDKNTRRQGLRVAGGAWTAWIAQSPWLCLPSVARCCEQHGDNKRHARKYTRWNTDCIILIWIRFGETD